MTDIANKPPFPPAGGEPGNPAERSGQTTSAALSLDPAARLHLKQLIRLTSMQAALFFAVAVGLALPHAHGGPMISLGNHAALPLWLAVILAISLMYAIPALWWAFPRFASQVQPPARARRFRRRLNWHAAVETLFALYVVGVAALPASPSAAGAAWLGGLYSALIVWRLSRLDARAPAAAAPSPEAKKADAETLTTILSEQKRLELSVFGSTRRQWLTVVILSQTPALLAFILPLEPLARWPWLRPYVNFMAHAVPAVAVVGRLMPNYAQLAQASQALAWPFVFAITLYYLGIYLVPLWRADKALCQKYFDVSFEAMNLQRMQRRSNLTGRHFKRVSKNRARLMRALYLLWALAPDTGLLHSWWVLGTISGAGLAQVAMHNAPQVVTYRFALLISNWFVFSGTFFVYGLIFSRIASELLCLMKRAQPDESKGTAE